MPHDIPAEHELLREATARLVRTVDGLADDAFAEPSGLPDWTRGHVVAHLALNADALAGVLAGVVQDEPVAMYPSQEVRDADIAELVATDPGTLRTRLLTGCAEFDDAVAAMPERAWSTQVERVPGGPTFLAVAALGMRLREVEIHHADLDAGFTPADWPPAFTRLLLDAMTKRGAGADPFVADPTDLDGTWAFGEGGPTVSGPAAALGWWLTGRGDGDGLSSDRGALPEVTTW